ncbi:MAG TPA: ribonucleoside triphosphate reductase [Nevskiaceae bacterium]|nr:ribonucleoside triphosphate reductase [Nevskiaceae bacterium]
MSIKKVKKRDGRIVPFNQRKITNAIWKAAESVGGKDKQRAKYLSDKVVKILGNRFGGQAVATVEQIQDIVEKVLMRHGHYTTAKAYILYRDLHTKLRDVKSLIDSDELVGNYINGSDWRIKENSNMAYSLQGLNNHVASEISKTYWLNKVYPKEARNAYLSGDLHIHDLYILAPYCMGWDLYDLLVKGFRGVPGKVASAPARHLNTALGQLVNFFYTLQGESAGANAFSNFDTLLAPFVWADKLNYKKVKQAMQGFIFNMNVPTRVGFQTPFSNVTLDLAPPVTLKDQAAIVGGEPINKKYGDFQKEMGMINRAFAEVMAEGDAEGRVFTFPIPTYNITNDFDWGSPTLEPVWDMTAKYGIPYFSNFVNSDMKPEEVRSMCCRLRLSNKELRKRGGGLFGANPLTGSIGVVTINMARIGFLTKNEKEFLERLLSLMEIARNSLLTKRQVLERLTEQGLYPYTRFYLAAIKKRFGGYWKNHFNTIGVHGMNEALLNLFNLDIGSDKGKRFAVKVLDFMRAKIANYQKEDNELFNLEATPAEGTTYRFATLDKKLYPKIKVANEKEIKKNGAKPYYTNSTQLPVGYTDDIFEALELQDELQTKYTGGCVEAGNKVLTNKGLLNIEYIVKNFEKLKPIKALSYNLEKRISEWDEIIDAVTVDVKNKNKIKVRGERALDIVTSDWHPFFVLEKIQVDTVCPICKKKVKNIKSFAAHLRYNPDCRKQYSILFKYKVVEKRADALRTGDYILQNSDNLYSNRQTKLNNDLMWLIGFFIGDGCISEFIDNKGGNKLKRYKVRFHSEIRKVLEKAKAILSKYFQAEVKVIQNDKRSKVLRELTTSKKEISEFFFKYGFKTGKKVYNISIPQKIKENLNKENIFSLLTGLVDSDGSISKRDGDFEYYTVSSRLADDILEICSQAGIMVSKVKKINKRENEVDSWRLRIPSYQVTEIKDKFRSSKSFRIKKYLSNRKKRRLPVVRVKEVSKIDVKENKFYDLMTRKNHNYLAGKNSLVFVHNTVVHGFLGESLPNGETAKLLVKRIAENYHLPYYTLTPTFSVCQSHGYLKGEQPVCPECGSSTEVFSRIVGYLRPVQQWNPGKQSEFEDRKVFKVQ